MVVKVALGTDELSVFENAGEVAIPFVRTGDPSVPVTVEYEITPVTATAGVDYDTGLVGTFGSFSMLPNQMTATLNVAILDDSLSEATEGFDIAIVNVIGGEPDVPFTANISILDDENPVPEPIDPPLVSRYDVTQEVVFSGINQPVNFNFSPIDPDLVYVAEKEGRIAVYSISTGAEVSEFIDIRDIVNSNQGRGLLDIELHPDFPNSPYVYAFFVVDPPDVGETGPDGKDGEGNRFSWVVRYTAALEDGDPTTNDAPYTTVVPGSGVILMGAEGQSLADISGGGALDFTSSAYANEPSSQVYLNPDRTDTVVINGYKQDYLKVDSRAHAGGSLGFGPDGALYVTTGDGVSYNYADPHGIEVQSLDASTGKVFRIDPITGDALADNPFYDTAPDPDSFQAKVWQLGLRNPYSMAIADDGRVFLTDTGQSGWEEINTGPAGTNFGWPFYEGGDDGSLIKTPRYKGLPEAADFYAAVAAGDIEVTAAYRAFAHLESQPGYQNQAITGGDVIYNGSLYPDAFKNDFFFSDYPGGRIYSVDINDRRDVEFLFQDKGTAPVHYSQGPDGYVYYADLEEGKIGRFLIRDPIGEAGRAVSSGLAGEWTSVAFAHRLDDPVVVMGPASFHDSEPVTVHVRNVTGFGFEFRVDEWSYLDGAHAAEEISWLAVESGPHILANGQRLVAGTVDAGDASVGATFGLDFGEAPVVIAQVMTEHDPTPVTADISTVSGSGFTVSVVEEEAADGVHASESVGFIAIESGGFPSDGVMALRTGAVVNEANTVVDFGGAMADQFAFLAQVLSSTSTDPATIRLGGLTDTSASLFIHEEQSADAETALPPEDVGVVAIQPGSLFEAETLVIGEAGQLTIHQRKIDDWIDVRFAQPLDDPSVVMGPATHDGKQPLTVEVRDVTSTGFQVRIHEWAYLDDKHVPEVLDWLAIEGGVHTLADGTKVAAGNSMADGTRDPVDFGTTFSDSPVVFAQATTQRTGAPLVTRVSDVGPDGFDVRLQLEEADTSSPATEDVAWIAMSTDGRVGGPAIGRTGNVVTDDPYAFAYGETVSDQSAFLAAMQTFHGRDVATVRQIASDGTGASVFIEEEQSLTAETLHWAEDVGYVAMPLGPIIGLAEIF